MDLPLNEGIDIIDSLIEEDKRRHLWEIYLINYAKMDHDSFESWEDFYTRATTPVSETPAADLLAMAADIQKELIEKNGNI